MTLCTLRVHPPHSEVPAQNMYQPPREINATVAATSITMYLLECMCSFVNWPPENTSVPPLSLANAGFKYTGYGDKVTCPVCAIEIEGWQSNRSTEPKYEHRIRSPTCLLALACDQPLQSSSDSSTDGRHIPTTVQTPINEHRTPPHPVVLSSSSTPSNGVSPSAAVNEMPSTNTSISPSTSAKQTSSKTRPNEVVCHSIATPQKKSVETAANPVPDSHRLAYEVDRMKTFSDWPTTAPVDPSDLAKCGFYYTGVGDRVKCAFCNGMLHSWTAGDVPASEHREHFPTCPLVRGLKIGNVPLESSDGIGELRTSEVRQTQSASARNTVPSSTQHVLKGPISEGASVFAATAYPISYMIQQHPQEYSSLQEDLDEEKRLETDNRQLLDNRLCKVCMDKMIDTVFLPCGHLVSCQECAPKLRDCPVCRTYIRGTVRSFFTSSDA